MTATSWVQDRSFRLKLIAAAIVAVVATVALLAWRNLALVEDALQAQTRVRVEQLSPLLNAALATPLAQRDYATIEEILKQARVERGIEYFVLFDAQGKRIASLGVDASQPLPELDRDLYAARGDRQLDTRIPITLAGRAYGALQYGISLRFLVEARAAMLEQMLAVSLAGIAFAAVLLFAVGFYATRRLAGLNAAGRRLGAGDLATRVADDSRDELGQLAQTFNAMAASLEARVSQLNASEERLYYAVRGSSDGIWDWDLVRDRYYLSPRYRELLGYDEDELPDSRDSFLDGLHPDDRDRVDEAVDDHFERHIPYDIEYRLRCRDGTYRWFRGRGQAVWDGEGRVIRFAGASSDITAQKRAEADMQALVAEQQALLDNVLVGIVFLKNRVILRCNRRFEKLFGFGEGEMIGRTTEIVYPSRAIFESVGAQAYAAVGRAETYSTELELRRRDGSLFWGFVTGRALDPAHAQDGSVWIYADVSERKQADEHVRKLNEELEQRVRSRTAELVAANRELEAFSYSVSHDLTAPLRGIDGFSRMLEEDYHERLDERGRGYIQRIRGGTQRMHQLIDDLLSLSRITRDEMKRERVCLSGLAEQILGELRQHQPQRRIEASITLGIDVEGDPNLLRIALENLLRNAWKFTARHASARIELGVLRLNGKPVYFVKDDGAGFDMKYAGKLFGAFQRMHRVSEFDGTGIGLAIVHRIIQRHGGRIWADAAPERGATFFFTLSQHA